MAEVIYGSKPRIYGRFYNASDSLTAPSTVYARVRKPNESLETYTYTTTTTTVTTTTTGVYCIDVTADSTGKWYVSFQGVGTCTAANETNFICRKMIAR